jgi:hypothetical protein
MRYAPHAARTLGTTMSLAGTLASAKRCIAIVGGLGGPPAVRGFLLAPIRRQVGTRRSSLRLSRADSFSPKTFDLCKRLRRIHPRASTSRPTMAYRAPAAFIYERLAKRMMLFYAVRPTKDIDAVPRLDRRRLPVVSRAPVTGARALRVGRTGE